MAYYVAARQADKGNPVDTLQDLVELGQAGPAAGQVDLCDVAVDYDLGAKTNPGQEHFQLFRGGVLGLVEDYEAPVQSAAPHIGERSHFDGPVVQQPARCPRYPSCRRERRRAGAGTGRSSPSSRPGGTRAFARFDSGPGHYYSLYRLGLERLNGQSDGEIALPRPRRANPERDDVGRYGVT